MQATRGEIVTGWLLRLVVLMTIIGLVGYDLLSVAFTWLTLDSPAREVAVAAASAYRDDRDLDDAREAAEQEAGDRGVELVDIAVEEDDIVVHVTRRASTLWLHRISEDATRPTVRGRARWAT